MKRNLLPLLAGGGGRGWRFRPTSPVKPQGMAFRMNQGPVARVLRHPSDSSIRLLNSDPMRHELEKLYDLTAEELLEAISRRFRLKVALEGAVAEVHLERKLKAMKAEGKVFDFEAHDVDGMHDFSVMTTEAGPALRVEVKNVRNYKTPKVEIQKTRTSIGDPSSRFYGHDQFDVIAVCMGKSTKKWSQFAFALTRDLPRHTSHPQKLAVFHEVGFPRSQTGVHWYTSLEAVLDAEQGDQQRLEVHERRRDLFDGAG